MEEYTNILHKTSEDFRRENIANCDRAKQKLEQNLGFKFRVNTEVIYDGAYHKNIIVELVEDDTDYKSLNIEYRNIERDMENGKSFEDSVFDDFVFVLAHENNRLNHYEANIFEKILSTYINNVEVFPDGNWYCINDEHGLCKYIDEDLFVNEKIVNTEDIISLNFKPNEIEIGIKDGCDDKNQVCGYLINNEGWKKVHKDGTMSDFKIVEHESLLKGINPELIIDEDQIKKIMNVNVTDNIIAHIPKPYIYNFNLNKK